MNFAIIFKMLMSKFNLRSNMNMRRGWLICNIGMKQI